MGRKITTTVTAGRNGGIHDSRAYKKACQWLDNHTHKNAQLWHIVFKGSDSRNDYETALDRLCDKLRDSGMAVEWKAAYEVDPTKGFHRHVFLLIEAAEHKPVAILRYEPDSWLSNMLASFNLTYHVAPPAGLIHRTGTGKQKWYAYVPKKAGAVLEDCKNWLSYIYKSRSKEGVEGPIYSSSRKKAKKAAPEAPEAPATQPTTNDNKGEAMTNNELPASAHTYLMGLYESYVDKQLNIAEIRAELVKAGVRRTLGQVVFDLDVRYGFAHYAETHPAPAPATYADLAALEKAKAAKPARILVRSQDGSKLVPSELPTKQPSNLGQKILYKLYELGHNSTTNF